MEGRSCRFSGQRQFDEENAIGETCFSQMCLGKRRSNRCRGKRPVFEKNSIDEAIDADEEDSEDDFEVVRYLMKQGSGGNDTLVKWTKRMILSRSSDSAHTIKESEITKGKNSASNDNKMIRNKKKKVEMEIKLKNGSLVVNKEVINEMLGLRNKGDTIMMNEVLGNEEMIQDWKDQFDVPEKDITPSIIKSKIRRSNVVDFNFELKIIMLFENIMGCCKKTGVKPHIKGHYLSRHIYYFLNFTEFKFLYF
nr:hypothetical protein [Tanacetum cinerariifolium]